MDDGYQFRFVSVVVQCLAARADGIAGRGCRTVGIGFDQGHEFLGLDTLPGPQLVELLLQGLRANIFEWRRASGGSHGYAFL